MLLKLQSWAPVGLQPCCQCATAEGARSPPEQQQRGLMVQTRHQNVLQQGHTYRPDEAMHSRVAMLSRVPR